MDAEAGVGAAARRVRVSLDADANVLQEAEAHEGEQAPERVLALPARLVHLARCARTGERRLDWRVRARSIVLTLTF